MVELSCWASGFTSEKISRKASGIISKYVSNYFLSFTYILTDLTASFIYWRKELVKIALADSSSLSSWSKNSFVRVVGLGKK
jgi:hypothetical protein